jgi:hypothetical protein
MYFPFHKQAAAPAVFPLLYKNKRRTRFLQPPVGNMGLAVEPDHRVCISDSNIRHVTSRHVTSSITDSSPFVKHRHHPNTWIVSDCYAWILSINFSNGNFLCKEKLNGCISGRSSVVLNDNIHISTSMMAAACFPGSSISAYKTTWRRIPESHNISTNSN